MNHIGFSYICTFLKCTTNHSTPGYEIRWALRVYCTLSLAQENVSALWLPHGGFLSSCLIVLSLYVFSMHGQPVLDKQPVLALQQGDRVDNGKWAGVTCLLFYSADVFPVPCWWQKWDVRSAQLSPSWATSHNGTNGSSTGPDCALSLSHTDGAIEFQ